MNWVDRLSQSERAALREEAVPEWTEPMLATLTRDYFSDPGWIFERKLDGERCLAFRNGERLRLSSRNRKCLNATYPELVGGLVSQSCSRFVVDGEIVAFEGKRTSFSKLQQRIGIRDPDAARASGIRVWLYLFDILHMDGRNVTRLGLRCRKCLLKEALHFSGPLRFVPHRNEHGERYREEACRRGWEGVIAKEAESVYVHSRSKKWLKFKCGNRQEFVIVGFTDPRGARAGFGALLLGYYADCELRYAGKVGTGFTEKTLESLGRSLRDMERDSPPIAGNGEPSDDGVHWVEPKIVVEIGFTEWTGAGRLRHSRFLGLRDDKAPGDVVREWPKDAP